MLLILTSSVTVYSTHTKLIDPKERERQYLDSFLFYIKESHFTNMIICDNSEFDFSIYNLTEIGLKNNKKVEILSFAGNKALIGSRGKGYGEGEIMEFIFRNSKLLKENDGFVKITGRIIIKNINKIIQYILPDKAYFQESRNKIIFSRDTFDTRIYYCPNDFFKQYLINSYLKVNDSQNYFLENCYFDSLAKAQIKPLVFKQYPKITGTSGSSNKAYDLPRYKYWIYNVVNYLYSLTQK